ncbi:addiction module protein [Spirochaeta isovalerica]|uniref:Putative addiction module component (TIGR02574 family) n=1 Tax=Spirochaeta isovalerica TaxID=150 RepID=A0A841RFE1_9SPIO|nr:addiction module protein [Spirochaeta isovalerica]MBB6482693.1 putative addiction module component (TIGR02574 family) [Spirochaeta isovalerica]
MSTQEMIKEALALSPKEKSQIIEALLLSLDQPDSKIEEIWNAEVDLRLDAIENGSTKTIPYKEIF